MDRAYREFDVTEPLVNDVDDDYAADQDYLDAAPTGIDARWAWTQPNAEGSGVGVIDLEQGWFPNHEDIVAKAPTLIYGDNRDGINGYKGNHGTAVLGEMIAEDNTVGVVGIAPAVTSVRMVSHYDAATDTALHVADAIAAAIPAMSAGDVLLLEVQRNFLPTETDDDDFDAIRLAVALGMVVVEAAGNGFTDLDAYMDAVAGQILNRASADFRDSGAIMVGAADVTAPARLRRLLELRLAHRLLRVGRERRDVRLRQSRRRRRQRRPHLHRHVQRHQQRLAHRQRRCPHRAGRYEALTATRLSPTQMRALLSDPATGTPQGPNVAGNIGVMPNLRAIIEDTLGLVPDLYLRDNATDTGAIPSRGAPSARARTSSSGRRASPNPQARPSAKGAGSENVDDALATKRRPGRTTTSTCESRIAAGRMARA